MAVPLHDLSDRKLARMLKATVEAAGVDSISAMLIRRTLVQKRQKTRSRRQRHLLQKTIRESDPAADNPSPIRTFEQALR
jgi:hypothetical protein